MCPDHIVLCGPVTDRSLPADDPQPLRLIQSGPNRNVYPTFADFSAAMYREPPPRFRDLLDVATYVYCADQATPRGDSTFAHFGADWRRNFWFRVAVRDLDFWNQSGVRATRHLVFAVAR